MSIPANITTELRSLQAQVIAAAPLANASTATITALQLNAGNLVADIQAALVAPGNLLDVWVSPIDPISIVGGVLSVLSASQDQNKLSLMRGVIGRVASNLDQL